MSVDSGYNGSNDISRPTFHQFHTSEGKENHAFPTIGENKTQIGAAISEGQKKPKGNASSQANDQELRRLYRENRHRDLKDVAASVLANERGPKSEKTKQIFAMNWYGLLATILFSTKTLTMTCRLSTVCKKSNTSVPRNRVYAQYAERCGTERVPLLNPASFGKLVRIIFPDITTRRLGMRGESKYHYVDLTLTTDDSETQQLASFQISRNESDAAAKLSVPVSKPPTRTHLPADTAEFSTLRLTFDSISPSQSPQPKTEAHGHLFLDSNLPGVHIGPSRPNMISRRLKFSKKSGNALLDDSPIILPSLQGYLPHGTDPDAAAALKALYRSHCVSVIDCVRFCKEKSFWHHFTSFHGTLTVPVQKLFAHPSVAGWISECDWLMYQKMIQFVSPLALQVMPEVVTNAFQSIADNLGGHILSVFYNHPQHVRDAKHGPAVIFAGLLGRLLRVNAASHAAAHILGNDATRDQMWHDWVHYVKPTVIVETCLPGVGYSRCIQILSNDIRDLLSPLEMTSHSGMQQIYVTTSRDFSANFSHLDNLDDSSTSSVLDRWVTFLHDLPSRFPNADARTLLYCVSDIGTAALRDITMATAVSFGQWTVTKVWVDEMMQWLAEKGGFLENPPKSSEMRPQKRSAFKAGLETEVHLAPGLRTGLNDSARGQGQQGSYEFDKSCEQEQGNDAHVRQHASFIGSQNTAAYFSFEQNNHQAPDQQGHQQPIKPQDLSESAGREQIVPSEPSSLHIQYQNQQQQSLDPHGNSKIDPPVLAHAMKEAQRDDPNDDSGIGLDLELPHQHTPIRLADYGGFVASNTNSDPADVVVC